MAIPFKLFSLEIKSDGSGHVRSIHLEMDHTLDLPDATRVEAQRMRNNAKRLHDCFEVCLAQWLNDLSSDEPRKRRSRSSYIEVDEVGIEEPPHAE